MKILISILLFSVVASFSNAVCAQIVSVENQPKKPFCNQELFEKAENAFSRRKYSSEIPAEKDLKEVIATCAEYSRYYQAEEYLKIVQEELAEHNYILAKYYWNKFLEGKMSKIDGVYSRLKAITEKYPNYSQITSVRQMFEEVDRIKSQMTENTLNQQRY